MGVSGQLGPELGGSGEDVNILEERDSISGAPRRGLSSRKGQGGAPADSLGKPPLAPQRQAEQRRHQALPVRNVREEVQSAVRPADPGERRLAGGQRRSHATITSKLLSAMCGEGWMEPSRVGSAGWERKARPKRSQKAGRKGRGRGHGGRDRGYAPESRGCTGGSQGGRVGPRDTPHLGTWSERRPGKRRGCPGSTRTPQCGRTSFHGSRWSRAGTRWSAAHWS